ncbi:MAG: MBL fold metallo-hydrolase [Clostridiales bacterium]|nr:MBL fold metallo-hydrolase [Clostridiales bacterium]
MKIRWLGHSCFLLTAADGTKIVTDPYDGTMGYKLPEVTADIVTTSHGHFDHNYTKGVRGLFTHIEKPGQYNIKGVGIHGTGAFHDEERGNKRGAIIIFVFTIDGLRICHCGDLGHMPDASMLREIGKVDVLMIPVGGTFTLDAEGAAAVVKAVNPAVTIPMHYKTRALTFNLDGVDKFLAASGIKDTKSVAAGKKEIEITSENLSGLPSVILLDYEPVLL